MNALGLFVNTPLHLNVLSHLQKILMYIFIRDLLALVRGHWFRYTIRHHCGNFFDTH